MRYTTVLLFVSAVWLSVGSASAYSIGIAPSQRCLSMCKGAYDGRQQECVKMCNACELGADEGYLPGTLKGGNPDCRAECKGDKKCVDTCTRFQASCCTPLFGCCPHDPKLCVCKPGVGIGC